MNLQLFLILFVALVLLTFLLGLSPSTRLVVITFPGVQPHLLSKCVVEEPMAAIE